MWEEIKEFGFPFKFIVGLLSYVAASLISINYNFQLLSLLLIVLPFLFGWVYFLVGSYIGSSFGEKSKKHKNITQLIALSLPVILTSISNYHHFSESSFITPKFQNYLIVSFIISVLSILALLIMLIDQRKNKANLLFIAFISIGLATIYFISPLITNTILKLTILLFGFSSLVTSVIIRVKDLLAGDELEKQIHLETLAYTFPISLIFLYFLFVLQLQFHLNSFTEFLGYAPIIIVLIYSFIVQLKKMKYS